MNYATRFQNRVVSSGATYDDRTPSRKQNTSVNDRLNATLLGLIEEESELSYRSLNCLRQNNIKLIGQLAQKTESELLRLKNFGRRSLTELKASLESFGLAFGMTFDFSPWTDGPEDTLLIQILSCQQNNGGFLIDERISGLINIDFNAISVKLKDENGNDRKQSMLSLSTEVIVNILSSDRYSGLPFLSDIIKKNQRWLKDHRI